MNKIWVAVALVIIALRLSLATLPGFTGDTTAWKTWFFYLQEKPFSEFYSRTVDGHTDGYQYAPGFLYLLWILGKVLPSTPPLSDQALLWILKIPGLLGDIFIATIVFFTVKKHRPKLSWPAAVATISHPALIFTTSVWGQIDSLFTAFILGAVVLQLEKNKTFVASLLYGFAIITKPQSLIAFPLWGLLLIKTSSIKRSMVSLLITLGVVELGSAPFFSWDPIFGFWTHLLQQGKLFPITSLFSFNLWAIFGWWQYDTQVVWGIPLVILGGVMFVSFILFLIFYLVRKKASPSMYYSAFSLAFFGFFILPTRIHERYLFPFIPFAILSVFLRPSTIKIMVFILISIFFFGNLYLAYIFSYPDLLNPIALSEPSHAVVKIMSLIFVVLFVSWLLLAFREDHTKPPKDVRQNP